MRIMANSPSPQLFLLSVWLPLLLHHLCPAAASLGSDFNHGPLTRFVCTPIPVDADPSCFPSASSSSGATTGPSGSGHQGSPSSGWCGASEEAKATILHLRENLVQQKETILDQRETIRELTTKLALCEGFGRGVLPHKNHHSTTLHPHHTNSGHSSNQQGHHENSNLIPDSPHQPSTWVQRLGEVHRNTNPGKNKHVTTGDMTSSPEQMERMLQALKDRLENLQKRNSSIAYSSSLKELLQRKIDALEEQLHHGTSTQDHHHDDSSHGNVNDRHNDHNDHHDDEHAGDHKDEEHGREEHPGEHPHDHSNNSEHTEHDEDSHSDEHHEDGDDDNDGSHHSNKAEHQSYLPHTGYRASEPRPGFYPNKLESVLNQLHFTGSSRRKPTSPDDFQISFPIRTNYMYGRVRKTLLQEIFSLTLCMWIKTGTGPGLGTPFSYSAPGQSNELVLIEWGNNPLELLIDDKAVTLPFSLSDGNWHHICVTWSTRDGHWEAYQDGMQRGSGMNLSPWHPIKPGGVFILGQEQDTLGGRFDATQSFVGEMSDVHMWSHVLSATDIYSLSSCSSHLKGDLIAWSDTEVELHGGLNKYPSDACH